MCVRASFNDFSFNGRFLANFSTALISLFTFFIKKESKSPSGLRTKDSIKRELNLYFKSK